MKGPFIHTAPRHSVDRTLELEQRVLIEGRLTVQLINAASGIIIREEQFANLITNAGLDSLGNTAKQFNFWAQGNNAYCGVGTGSTAPANTDTTLVTEIAPASSNRTQSDGSAGITTAYVTGPPDYWWWKRTWLFVEAQANGNLTEVGVFDAVTAGAMFMRQLLKDSGGAPTTIVKTSAEQLKIIWEFRIYPPVSDVAEVVTISGTAYTITHRAMGASSANDWGRLGTLFPSSNAGRAYEVATLQSRTAAGVTTSGVDSSSQSYAAYVSANYYRDLTLLWEPGIANFAGGIGRITTLPAFFAASSHVFQSSFSPAFTKDNTKRLTLVVRIAWGRA